jgi:hypothetical protein
MVKVVAGSGGKNTWSFDVDTSTFAPDEYLVKISGVLQDVTASTRFNVVQCEGTGGTCSVPMSAATIVSSNVTATATTPPQDAPVLTSTSIPATTQQSPVPVAVCLGSIATVLVLRRVM